MLATTTLRLDDIDRSRSTIGRHLVLEHGAQYRLFTRSGGELHHIGTYPRASDALAALDDIDLW